MSLPHIVNPCPVPSDCICGCKQHNEFCAGADARNKPFLVLSPKLCLPTYWILKRAKRPDAITKIARSAPFDISKTGCTVESKGIEHQVCKECLCWHLLKLKRSHRLKAVIISSLHDTRLALHFFTTRCTHTRAWRMSMYLVGKSHSPLASSALTMVDG